MEIHQLRYFVAVAEAGAISRAAVRCHVAQPSLSQQIRRLEQSLGLVLFDRLGRGVELTDAGRALLPRARRILAEVQDAEANLRQDVDQGRGCLRIGAIPTMAPYLLPRSLDSLRTEFPLCELVIREDLTERLVEALVDNRLDCAIMSTPVDHDQISLEWIGTERLVVVVASSDALAKRTSVALDALRNEPAVTLHEMHCLGQQISSFCSMKRIRRIVRCQTTQMSTLLEFVAKGFGFSFVPEMIADQDASDQRTYLSLRSTPPTRDIALAIRAGRQRPRIVESFAATIREVLKATSRSHRSLTREETR